MNGIFHFKLWFLFGLVASGAHPHFLVPVTLSLSPSSSFLCSTYPQLSFSHLSVTPSLPSNTHTRTTSTPPASPLRRPPSSGPLHHDPLWLSLLFLSLSHCTVTLALCKRPSGETSPFSTMVSFLNLQILSLPLFALFFLTLLWILVASYHRNDEGRNFPCFSDGVERFSGQPRPYHGLQCVRIDSLYPQLHFDV